ncbi:hypothetical protein [Rhizobium leguminosarum]|uniref:hypothetical protein n=1 Tax=Rhizobium leguminosarum TaxID=384 RepID=UPI001C9270CD|nr:hypothetical protein [Rhizobium leguminosarum]MBY2973073.1 hypothetical protein [Rhizobium leguminosarum]MBY2980473.1 hypothetical protein [Rhizobium leguminosarum]MBY3009024.1 hypothetical protein [Rhizobium leguminosarum]
MSAQRPKQHLFDRLVTVHRVDCTALVEAEPRDITLPMSPIEANAFSDYGLNARPIYEDLRRVVGQIAGLLILARLTKRSELLELAEFEACRQRNDSARDHLRALEEKTNGNRHWAALKNCQALCEAILRAFPDWKRGFDRDAEFDLMQERLEAAYRSLSASSSAGGGMMMVDFSHACCSCASSERQAFV